MEFREPWNLILASFLVPVAITLYVLRTSRPGGAFRFPSLLRLAQAPAGFRLRTRHLSAVLRCLALLALLFALAKPYRIEEQTQQLERETDFVLAIDRSGSMAMRDLQGGASTPSRMQAVQQALSQMIQRKKGRRFGLTVIGEEASYACPLTDDQASVLVQLKALRPFGAAAQKASALSDALWACLAQLKGAERSRAIVLVTDGVEGEGTDIPSAAEALSTRGIKLHVLAVGADFRQETPFSRLLWQIALATRGSYAPVHSSAKLAEALQTIEGIEAGRTETLTIPVKVDKFRIFAIPAAALLLLELLLSHTAYRKFP